MSSEAEPETTEFTDYAKIELQPRPVSAEGKDHVASRIEVTRKDRFKWWLDRNDVEVILGATIVVCATILTALGSIPDSMWLTVVLAVFTYIIGARR